jgi:hypothetical protein
MAMAERAGLEVLAVLEMAHWVLDKTTTRWTHIMSQ